VRQGRKRNVKWVESLNREIVEKDEDEEEDEDEESWLVAGESEVAGGVMGRELDGGVDAEIVPGTVDVFSAEEMEAVGGPGEADAG
jgi:hypothetical protein